MKHRWLLGAALVVVAALAGCTLIYASRGSKVTTIQDETVSGTSNKVGKIEIKPR